jgi:hypothetical protein
MVYLRYLSLFHGKSENKMDELGVPPFQEPSIFSAVAESGQALVCLAMPPSAISLGKFSSPNVCPPSTPSF